MCSSSSAGAVAHGGSRVCASDSEDSSVGERVVRWAEGSDSVGELGTMEGSVIPHVDAE